MNNTPDDPYHQPVLGGPASGYTSNYHIAGGLPTGINPKVRRYADISKKRPYGRGAAAVVAGVPGAVQATQTDPVAVLVRKARAYQEWLDRRNFTASDDEFNDLCGHLCEMEYEIRDTPATSFEAIAGKVRIAWEGSAFSDMARDGPPEEFDEVFPLDPIRFIWSAPQDLERLAGEA